eukprot:2144514-Rhodomonas_salina.1
MRHHDFRRGGRNSSLCKDSYGSRLQARQCPPPLQLWRPHSRTPMQEQTPKTGSLICGVLKFIESFSLQHRGTITTFTGRMTSDGQPRTSRKWANTGGCTFVNGAGAGVGRSLDSDMQQRAQAPAAVGAGWLRQAGGGEAQALAGVPILVRCEEGQEVDGFPRLSKTVKFLQRKKSW